MTSLLAHSLQELLDAASQRDAAAESFRFGAPGRETRGVFDAYNRRLKLYDITPEAFRDAAFDPRSRPGSDPSRISKLTVYTRPGEDWESLGFRREGTIHGYFADGVDADLWAAYTDPARAHSIRDEEHRRIVALALTKERATPALPEGYSCRIAAPADAGALAELLGSVFDDYPTSLDSVTLRRLMEHRTHHFRMIHDPRGALAAAASAEMDHRVHSAEMTDCATRPDQRGRGLMAFLLMRLGEDLPALHDIRDFYTLARADEIGMNCAFSKLGYTWTGRLVNNCRMPNGWESMNVWCRAARRDAPAAFPAPGV